MEEELIDPAIMGKIEESELTRGSICKGFRSLARMAEEINAAHAEAKIGWLNEDSDEPVSGKYHPKLILRVERL